MDKVLQKIKQNMLEKEILLSCYACKSEQAVKLREEQFDMRPDFFKDIDRIIHSLGYTRYIDKTQVFSFIQNDHITHRVLHVQLVAKIARTIGRSLNLNEDLIEAIALGHDIGHTPFGHTGEKFLNDICIREGIGYFCHNAQSVRVLKDLENLNITVQTLDGILAHNGEILQNVYAPDFSKTKEQFIEDLDNVFNTENYSKKVKSMTLEGCVVRISDIIAYIGRDIEDGITVGAIKRSDIPYYITRVLGNNNSKIVDTLVKDIVINSQEKEHIELSKDVFEALMELKRWNYKNIYESEMAIGHNNVLENLFNNLFDAYLERIENINYLTRIEIHEDVDKSDKIFYDFLNNKTIEYLENTDKRRIIIDYIAGQTDKFFLNECEKYVYGFRNNMLQTM